MNNPILEQIDLPIFDQIKAEHIYPAITAIINENKTKIKEIEKYEISKIDYKFVDELSLLLHHPARPVAFGSSTSRATRAKRLRMNA